MPTDVFIYDLDELEDCKGHISSILGEPYFKELGEVGLPDYDFEVEPEVLEHGLGKVYVEWGEEEITIYDPERLIAKEFQGLVSASTDQEILEK